jgi:multiple sugar transport system substrate-binding protein
MSVSWRWLPVVSLSLALVACAREPRPGVTVVTFPGSAVGREGTVLAKQLERFSRTHPNIRVEQRRTPDNASQRHQLYVQWLNAHADDPDILQLDVVWTAEFAAAGWILPLDERRPPADDWFPASRDAASWNGSIYAVPWFIDVPMLYWRTDVLDAAPTTFESLSEVASPQARKGLRYGFVWQGARYEGLVTVFLEHLGGFGGRILDDEGRVVVDSEAAVRALEYMQRSIPDVVPRAVLTWHEEETRFAFENGEALLMRNWPYAYPLLADPAQSRVAGRFAVASMPVSKNAPGARPTATLGGSELAINAYSDVPDAAFAVIEYLTAPEQMHERAAEVGQYPARRSLYDGDSLTGVLPLEPARLRELISGATARPVTPVYTELSDILQIHLHRALAEGLDARTELTEAASEIRAMFARYGLSGAKEAHARGRAEHGRKNAGVTS